MQILHRTSVSMAFTKAISKGVEYIDETHYVQSEGNKTFFRPLIATREPVGDMNVILEKFKAIIRKYKARLPQRLDLSFHLCPGINQTTLRMLGTEIAENFRNLKELNFEFFYCALMMKQ